MNRSQPSRASVATPTDASRMEFRIFIMGSFQRARGIVAASGGEQVAGIKKADVIDRQRHSITSAYCLTSFPENRAALYLIIRWGEGGHEGIRSTKTTC